MQEYVTLRLNAELWEEQIELQKALGIRGWKPPEAFTWQWDGQTYTVEPGKTITVPQLAAEQGVKASAVFERAKDEHGNKLMFNDKMSARYPMLETVKRFRPEDPSEPSQMPAEEPYRCPWTGKTFSDREAFQRHVEQVMEKRIAALTDEPEKPSRESPKEAAKRRIAELAAERGG